MNKRRILFLSNYMPGVAESIGKPDPTISGWPAVFHTVNGFYNEGWSIKWLIASEVKRTLPADIAIDARVVYVPFLRHFFGLWRRRWCWRLAGLGALFVTTVQCFWNARREIKREKPDLVYCFCENTIPAGALLKWFYGVKVVNRILGAQSLGREAWLGKSAWQIIWADPQYAIQFIVPADIKVITNDGSTGDLVAEKYGKYNKSKIFLMLNGVDKECSKSKGDNTGVFTIGSFSRLTKMKKVDALIMAAGVLIKKGLEIKLIVAGGGTEEGSLKALAIKFGLSDKISWLGQVKGSVVKNKLLECDLVVVAHDYSNLPNTLWEAMACGTCVLSVDDPGAKNVLEHNRNAYLMGNNFDPQVMAKAIEHLYSNRGELERIGENGKLFMNEKLHSWQDRIKKEIEYIERHLLNCN